MENAQSRLWDMLRLIRHGGPALCNIAITNSCNARCDFCNFANGKIPRHNLRWLDAERLEAALQILHGRGIRYISFFGGEPLLHPHLTEMISMSVAKGMGAALITNGWLLPAKLNELAASGVKTIYISIDAATSAAHEENRGLKGLIERIRAATARMPELGITPIAQVAMSKLITDYEALGMFLRDLGFRAVAFSYPQRARLGSSSLAWSDTSNLVNFADRELVDAFDAVDNLRCSFPVNNPQASVADMKRHLLGEPEHFVCYAGYKSFYMDWNFNIWRCDAWQKPMCTVWDFDKVPLIRDGCKACIADCYRDSSVMLHFAVSLGDAVDRLQEGKLLSAIKAVASKRNLESLRAVFDNASIRARLSRVG
jgi:MoaA/NifB/PqqE/SkfB family radical SAM enzyme